MELENASLQAKISKQKELITTMQSELDLLSQQKAVQEQQNHSLAEAKQKLEAVQSHLEQKTVSQQASIQNLSQVRVLPVLFMFVYLFCMYMYMYVNLLYESIQL